MDFQKLDGFDQRKLMINCIIKLTPTGARSAHKLSSFAIPHELTESLPLAQFGRWGVVLFGRLLIGHRFCLCCFSCWLSNRKEDVVWLKEFETIGAARKPLGWVFIHNTQLFQVLITVLSPNSGPSLTIRYRLFPVFRSVTPFFACCDLLFLRLANWIFKHFSVLITVVVVKQKSSPSA